MRILLVSTSNPRIDPRQLKLLNALKSFGHQVDTYWIKPVPFLRPFKLLKRSIRSIRMSLSSSQYDVIHLVDGWDVGLLPFLLAKSPKVFDVRSLWPFTILRKSRDLKSQIRAWIRRQITKLLARNSDHVTTVDPHLAQRLKRMRPRSLSFLRNLPSRKMFENIEYSGDENSVNFGWFGSINPRRRMDMLLKAWLSFQKQTTKECNLWIYGWNCGTEEFFQTRIEPYLEDESIHFVGRIPFEEVPHQYKRMDFIVAPNAGDHWQLKLGEALAAGVPLIVRYGNLHHKLVGDKGVVYFHSKSRETDAAALEDALIEAVEKVKQLKHEARNKRPKYWEEDVKRLVCHYYQIKKSS